MLFFKDGGVYHKVNYILSIEGKTWQTEGTTRLLIAIDPTYIDPECYSRDEEGNVLFGLKASFMEGWIIKSDEDLTGRRYKE